MGVLKYLQFYNLTCNDCGGWKSNRCINGTSCTLPVYNCTCANAAVATVPNATLPSPEPSAASDNASTGGTNETGANSSTPEASPAPTARRLMQATDAGVCNYTQFS